MAPEGNSPAMCEHISNLMPTLRGLGSCQLAGLLDGQETAGCKARDAGASMRGAPTCCSRVSASYIYARRAAVVEALTEALERLFTAYARSVSIAPRGLANLSSRMPSSTSQRT
jgi:hypothetical protein